MNERVINLVTQIVEACMRSEIEVWATYAPHVHLLSVHKMVENAPYIECVNTDIAICHVYLNKDYSESRLEELLKIIKNPELLSSIKCEEDWSNLIRGNSYGEL